MSARRAGHRPDGPVCAGCGYSTRGISELTCPECGADLRKVGIALPGDNRSPLAGCVPPLLATVLVFLIAVLGYNLAGLVVPDYQQQSTHFDLYPESDQYSHVLFQTEVTLIIPPGSSHSSSWFTMTSSGYPPTTSITLGNAGAKAVPQRIMMEVMPQSSPTGTVTYGPRFEVDPETRHAAWTDDQGMARLSQGPVTDKDVLAFLGSMGADTANPQVIAEAQQLHAMIDGLINGASQFTLNGFDRGGYGSGGGQQLGPVWFLPAYAGVWFVAWIVLLILIARRARKKQTTAAAPS